MTKTQKFQKRQRSSATPTRSSHENERIFRFQTLCRTLADVAEWPTSISSRSAHVIRRYVFFHPAWKVWYLWSRVCAKMCKKE